MPQDLRSIAIIVVGLLTCVVIVGLIVFARSRPRTPQGRTARDPTAVRICESITGYFARSGVPVEVDCICLRGNARYTVFIESEPMKRFRLSHQVELMLIEHVSSTCKLEVDRIYWRFVARDSAVTHDAPKPTADQVSATGGAARTPQPVQIEQAAAMSAAADDSIEASEQYANLPKVEVTELSWESYQEASGSEADKRTP